MAVVPFVPGAAVPHCLADCQPAAATGFQYAPSSVEVQHLKDGNVAAAVQGLRSLFLLAAGFQYPFGSPISWKHDA